MSNINSQRSAHRAKQVYTRDSNPVPEAARSSGVQFASAICSPSPSEITQSAGSEVPLGAGGVLKHNAEGISLIQGDCLQVMRSMPDESFDVVITSPPYNLGEGMEDKGGYRVAHKGSLWSGSRLRNGYDAHDDAMPWDEYVKWQRQVLAECWRVTRGAIYYNHKPRIVKGRLRTPLELVGEIPVRQIVIWDRGSGFNYMGGAYVPQHEWIVLMAKPGWTLREKAASGAGDVWRIPPDSGNDHPASFPLALPRTAIETSGAQSVLDPFAGSGTTLVAARNLQRRATGIELSEGYCALAVERLSMGPLFAGGFKECVSELPKGADSSRHDATENDLRSATGGARKP